LQVNTDHGFKVNIYSCSMAYLVDNTVKYCAVIV
jgi:hypothetical protein